MEQLLFLYFAVEKDDKEKCKNKREEKVYRSEMELLQKSGNEKLNDKMKE